MVVVFVLLALGVIAAVSVFLVQGRPVMDDDPVVGRPFEWPPESGIDSAAINSARFSVVVRGYRMSEVDAVLRDCAAALAQRDQQIAEIRSQSVAHGDDGR